MSDLITFLNARLDEDEAAAWAVHDVSRCDALLYEEDMSAAAARTPDCDCGYPARALREVEAKRAILTEHAATDWTAYGDRMCRRCVHDDDEPHDELHHWMVFPCPTVRHLAAIWSDHPDYRQEWAS